jgi:hypothetical protein
MSEYMKNNSKFNVGDKVAYSVKFLRSIGEGPTSPLCHARGTITEIRSYSKNFQIALISWADNHGDNGILPDGVNCANLAKVPGSKTVREDGTVGTVQPNMTFCQC